MNTQIVKQIVDLIVQLANPEKIILFGSYARGDFSQNSDIDLLIIKKDLYNSRSLTNKIYDTLYENKIFIPLDIISIDSEKYNMLCDDIGYIYKTITEEGVTVFN